MKNITKELFVDTINQIQKQVERDSKCSEAFKTLLPNDYVSGYDNSVLYNQIIKILQTIMNDDKHNSWIDYYIWELNFGEKYKDGFVILNGIHHELITPEDLYELLLKTSTNGK